MDSHKRSTQLERLEVVETGRRRRWSVDEKLRIVTRARSSPDAYGLPVQDSDLRYDRFKPGPHHIAFHAETVEKVDRGNTRRGAGCLRRHFIFLKVPSCLVELYDI
jgi:hypothetical protein